MKTIRTILLMMPVLMITGVASAQEYKLAVQNPKDTRLVLKDFSGQLPVEGYNGTEIVITSNSGRFEPPEKAKGLKPIFPGGTDNTGIGLEVLKSDNLVKITCLVPFTQDAEYKIKVPENLSLEMSSGCERSNDITITGMKNEIDINSCHDINLKNISGPVVLSTISGDINITYSSVSAAKATSVNSVSGDIDITLPVKTAVDLELRTVTGAFYSDFDFSQTQKDLKRIGGNEMNYSLNGGGFKFTVGTVSGNIYLRKGI